MTWLFPVRTSMSLAALGIAFWCGSSRPALAQVTSHVLPRSLDLGSAQDGPGGLSIYGASAFVGYADFRSPSVPTVGDSLLSGRTTFGGGSITGGWRKKWARSQGLIVYTLFYSKAPELFQSGGFGHALRLNWNTSLSRKWRYSASGQSSISNLQDSLSQPEVFSFVETPAANFPDLASAAAAGQFTNSQIASMLTGAPILESPARTLLFGQRMLNSSLQNSVTYARSSRLSVNFSLGANRAQHWGRAEDQPSGVYLMPAITAVQGGVGINYSLSSRTQIGVDAFLGRTYSFFEDARTTSTTGTFGRNVGRRWNLSAFGGVATIQPLAHRQPVTSGPQYLAGGSAKYRTRDQLFVLAYNHSLSTLYAYGVQAVHGVSAGWSWTRPTRRWSTGAQWAYQNSDQGASGIGDIVGWTAQTRFSYRLNENFYASAQWAYLRNDSSSPTTLPNYLNGSTYRLSLSWQPVAERRPL